MGISMSSSSGNSSGRRYSSYPYYQYPNYYYPPFQGTASSYPPPPHPPPPNYGQHPIPPPHMPPNYNYPGWSGNASSNYANPSMVRPSYPNYYGDQSSGGWWAHTRYAAPVPPFVEHQSTITVKNDVNVHKGSVRFDVDESHPDHHLVSFVFDAEFDGSITIYYLAKEDKENPNITPMRPEVFEPLTVPFQKGLGQKFQQPSGTGVDLGFFEFDELANPSQDETIFPLVILAQVFSSSNQSGDEYKSNLPGDTKTHFQFTMAVIEKKNGASFQVKVMKQILWINGVRYELQDLYGIANNTEEGFTDDEPGKECVICLTEPKNTAVLPCRHLCMCEDCAKELRLQSNKCPICRTPITELIEININQ